MEKLIEILEEINPEPDYATCTTLIKDGILNSFMILNLVSELEDAFDIEISPAELTPANFNSAGSLWKMIERLQDE